MPLAQHERPPAAQMRFGAFPDGAPSTVGITVVAVLVALAALLVAGLLLF